MIEQPTPSQIRAARERAGLTQQQAAVLVHMEQRGWARWELGERAINLAAWELFLLRVGQHPTQALKPAKLQRTPVALTITVPRG